MKWSRPNKNFPKKAMQVAVLSVLASGLGIGSNPQATHANLPVIDLGAIAQSVKNYNQLVDQYQTMLQQVSLLQDQIKSATGHYGQGASIGAVDEWKNTSWDDIADMVNNGVNPGDGEQVRNFKAAREKYKTQFPMPDASVQTGDPRMKRLYDANYAEAIGGLGIADASLHEVGKNEADLEALRKRIDVTDNLKSAIDLNTAVNIKAAQINAQIARIQALQLHLQAASQNSENSSTAAQAEFFGS